MPYELHLNLRQRAALRIAISFWESKKIQAKAANFFRTCDISSIFEVRDKWDKLTKTVVDEWNKDVLPQTLQTELIHLLKLMGHIILTWYLHITKEYGVTEDSINCINKIKWTPYGTVDEVQTFKSSLLNNSNIDITKIYNSACRYAMEDCINDLWDKIPHNIQTDCYKDIYTCFDQHIIAYWKHCKDNHLPMLMRCFQAAANDFDREDMQVFNLIYEESHSTEENMLRLTVYQGYFNAMKYFWVKLTKEEKNKSVLKCAYIAVLRLGHYILKYDSIGEYKMKQCLEICIFLMNQMSKRDKKSFYNDNLQLELGVSAQDELDVKNKILSTLFFTWPWEELFFPVLEDILHYVDDNSKMDCKFLSSITLHMCEDHELGYTLKASKYRSVFRNIWLIIPAHFKRKIAQINPYSGFINYLIHVWDLDSLNLIINDPEIAAVRDQFIDLGWFFYKKLVVNDQFEKLDQLIKEVFKFEGEGKKSFKQKINPWSDIFKNHRFDLADKLLDWQSSTPEERQSLKNNIDHMALCMEFIDICNYESFDKFLDWKFETIEKRISCEEHFKSDIFVIRRVYDIWMSDANVDDVKRISSRFLDWAFESNEEIKCFKKEKLVNLENDQLVIDALVMLQLVGNINEFLFWCLLDGREISRIKQAVSIRFHRLV